MLGFVKPNKYFFQVRFKEQFAIARVRHVAADGRAGGDPERARASRRISRSLSGRRHGRTW
jgi:hypothetical protein